ncbi:MAG: hypothetical protein SPC23_00620 [Lachnospiraceae bacterium]|jgi:hypothetical protein|nr:hypothetical protein [Lachnospiraceae bacterium]
MGKKKTKYYEKRSAIQEIAEKNEYVKDIHGTNLIYKTEFYIRMCQQMNKGMTGVEAYESLGFPVKELGADRANSAAKRAREMEKDGSFVDPSRFDGSIPRDEMGDLTPEEEAAYYKARTAYLEALLELEKKVHELLAETNTSSNPN